MKIVCDQCGAKYSIDDTKVQNKNFKITCKKCDHKIVIQNKKEEHQEHDDIAAAAAANWADEINHDDSYDEGATRVFNYAEMNKVFEDAEKGNDQSVVEASSIEPIEWYLHVRGDQVGPLSLEEAQKTVSQEGLSGEANGWCTGMPEWKMLKDIPEMKDYIKAPVAASTNPFGSSDDSSSAFGSASLLNDSESESLFKDKSSQPAASSNLNTATHSDTPFGGVSSSFGGNRGGGVDLRSLIDSEDLEDDEEEDASSKSKVIDFREIAGENAQRVVVHQASFNVSGGGEESKKGLLIAMVVLFLLAIGGVVAFLMLGGKSTHKFTVISKPIQGAEVYIDGELKGVTPLNALEIEPGGHKIKIEKEGYQKISRSIRISEDLTKSFELKKEVYTIKFVTEPEGVDLYIDGELIGKTPVETKVEHGKRGIRLAKQGYQDLSLVVNAVKDGEKKYKLEQAVAVAVAATPTPPVAQAAVKETASTAPKKVRSSRRSGRRSGKGSTKKTPVKKQPKSLTGDLPVQLTKSQVLKVINRTRNKMRGCVAAAGRSGTIGARFVIQRTGRVKNVQVANNAGGAKGCMLQNLKRMRFPAFSGKEIPVTFPFKF